jgi:hypothetical protein
MAAGCEVRVTENSGVCRPAVGCIDWLDLFTASSFFGDAGSTVHTNTVESVWSLLKRSIIGSYHRVSIKHLDAYLDELEHRFNDRKNEYIFRDMLAKLVNAAKLPYSELVKAA